MEAGAAVVIWLLSVVSLASIAMAIFCARLTFLLAKEVSTRDLGLIESALRFHKANSLEEVIRANALDRSLKELMDTHPLSTSGEEEKAATLSRANSPEVEFQDRLTKFGEAKDGEGITWRLE